VAVSWLLISHFIKLLIQPHCICVHTHRTDKLSRDLISSHHCNKQYTHIQQHICKEVIILVQQNAKVQNFLHLHFLWWQHDYQFWLSFMQNLMERSIRLHCPSSWITVWFWKNFYSAQGKLQS
jgi:hypothetical protein